MKAAVLTASVGLAVGWSMVRNMQLPMGPSRLHWSGTVFGHRGCRNVPGIPENTLDAFKYAVSRGCEGIECDVRLTKDNEVVIYHDAFANGHLREVDPKKRIDELTLFELKTFSFGEDPTEQIRVPTLEESILFCRENNLRMLIEIKEVKRPKLCTDKVLDLYRRYPDYMYEHTTIISFVPTVLYHARTQDRNVATGQIYEPHLLQTVIAKGVDTVPWYVRLCPSLVDKTLVIVQEKLMPWVGGVSMICPHFSMYTDAYRRRWNSRRIAVYLWGFHNSGECTLDMRQPGVCVSADDMHEQFTTAPPEPDFDIFGDRQRERERQEEERRKQLKLQK